MCIGLTYVQLSIHSTHCHDGALYKGIQFSVDQTFFSAYIEWQYVLSIPTVHLKYKNLTLR